MWGPDALGERAHFYRAYCKILVYWNIRHAVNILNVILYVAAAMLLFASSTALQQLLTTPLYQYCIVGAN